MITRMCNIWKCTRRPASADRTARRQFKAESCVVFNTGPYTVLPDNSILITANMQSETGFPSSHQLKSYVASKSRLKLAARAVLSADAGLLVLTGHLTFGTVYLTMLFCLIQLICLNLDLINFGNIKTL